MKRIVSLLMVSFLLLSFAGCDGESPRQAVKKMFDALKSSNMKKVSKYIDYNDLPYMDDINRYYTDAEIEELLVPILRDLEYKIISSKKNGKTAIVKAEITNTDMSLIFTDLFSEAFALAFSGLDGDTIKVSIKEKLIESLNQKDNKTATKIVDINLNKSKGSWEIHMSDELVNAIMGGPVGVTESMTGHFGRTTKPEKLDKISNWLISDIWNKGFCSIRNYNSFGDISDIPYDIDLTIEQLNSAMKKKVEYDRYMRNLSDEYAEIKNMWGKLSPEIESLHEHIKSRSNIKALNNKLETSELERYLDDFTDLVNELNN